MEENRLLVIGANGIGKSNLLEAVELLGSLRSHRTGNDQDLIFSNENQALLRGLADDDETIELQLRKKGGRQAYRNNKLLDRQLDLLGPLRCVGFSALDLELVRGEPSLRRNWLDRVIQQLEPIYTDLISRFGKLMRQRNQLWRMSLHDNRDELLDAFDIQMALLSTRIHRRRIRVLRYLQPLASQWQERLSNGKECLNLEYLPGSHLEGKEDEDLWKALIQKQLFFERHDEERLGICRVGPHRDEVTFSLNGLPARRLASAGQQRTIVLALKLAELELVGDLYGNPPILLLDDVLAELDPVRQLLLLEAVGGKNQCLISATHIDAFAGDWLRQSQVLELEFLKDISGIG